MARTNSPRRMAARSIGTLGPERSGDWGSGAEGSSTPASLPTAGVEKQALPYGGAGTVHWGGFPQVGGHAGVAQLAEQTICNRQVVGSIPTAGSVGVGVPPGRRTAGGMTGRFRVSSGPWSCAGVPVRCPPIPRRTGRSGDGRPPDVRGRARAGRAVRRRPGASPSGSPRPLSAEDQTVQSMPDVSPTKWHRAHTSWFFETFLLVPSLAGYELFHPDFGYLFNSYYVGRRRPVPAARPGPGVPARASSRSPTTGATWTRQMGDAAAAGTRPRRRRSWSSSGIQHEQQHQELLLMDIKHVLSRNPLLPAYAAAALPPAPGRPRPTTWTAHPGRHRSRSVTSAAGSASTTSSPATASTSSPSPWPTAP